MTHPSREFLELQTALAGEYSLERELGRGGMGIVYLARDVQLDRDVAIKVLPAHLAQTAESRERFLREARTAAGLSHPHIVPIHRVGEAGGFVFFVMSYVAGELDVAREVDDPHATTTELALERVLAGQGGL
jgi:serine/threonine-protein kinase